MKQRGRSERRIDAGAQRSSSQVHGSPLTKHAQHLTRSPSDRRASVLARWRTARSSGDVLTSYCTRPSSMKRIAQRSGRISLSKARPRASNSASSSAAVTTCRLLAETSSKSATRSGCRHETVAPTTRRAAQRHPDCHGLPAAGIGWARGPRQMRALRMRRHGQAGGPEGLRYAYALGLWGCGRRRER